MTDGSMAPLRWAPFRFLWLGRTATALGSTLLPVALAFAVLDLTGSVISLGLVLGARSLMHVVFVLFGGMLADRLPRQSIMVWSSALSTLSQAVLAVLVLGGMASLPTLVALSALNGIVSAFAMPASSALTPQTVPNDVLKQANALIRLGMNFGSILGASCGGITVALLGPGWGIAITAVPFAVAAGAFALVRIVATERQATRRPNPLEGMRDGWDAFSSRTWIWLVVLAAAAINGSVIASLQILGPAIADDSIGRKAWGFVLAAQSVGMVFGALVALRLRTRRTLALGVGCLAIGALPPIVLALRPVLGLLVAAAFAWGMAIEQFAVAWETSLQRNISADMLGRIYSYDIVGSMITIPLAQVAVAPIANGLGTTPTLIGVSVIVLSAALVTVASPGVRHLELERHRSDEVTMTS